MDTTEPEGFPSPKPRPETHHLLHATHTGTLALLTPLPEPTYRRLLNLSTYLSATLDHACGLNPKSFRSATEGDGSAGAVSNSGGGVGARGVVDGSLCMRWGELGWGKQREGLSKVGGEEGIWWGEREVLAGWGVFGGR